MRFIQTAREWFRFKHTALAQGKRITAECPLRNEPSVVRAEHREHAAAVKKVALASLLVSLLSVRN